MFNGNFGLSMSQRTYVVPVDPNVTWDQNQIGCFFKHQRLGTPYVMTNDFRLASVYS